MNKFFKLPMPRAPFSVAISECSQQKPKQPRSLKNKLMICSVLNIFALVLLVGVCAATINQTLDAFDGNFISDFINRLNFEELILSR